MAASSSPPPAPLVASSGAPAAGDASELAIMLANLIARLDALPPGGAGLLDGLKKAGAWRERPLPPMAFDSPCYVAAPVSIVVVNVSSAVLAAAIAKARVATDGHGSSILSLVPPLKQSAQVTAAIAEFSRASLMSADQPMQENDASLTTVERTVAQLLRADASSTAAETFLMGRPTKTLIGAANTAPASVRSGLAADLRRLLADVQAIQQENARIHGAGTISDPYVANSGPLYVQAPMTLAFAGVPPAYLALALAGQRIVATRRTNASR